MFRTSWPWVLLACLALSLPALASRPEDATPEARAQVARALGRLKPFFKSSDAAKVRERQLGTLEHAIAMYAPKTPWPVDEGVILATRDSAKTTCPEGMQLVHSRSCVDVFEGALIDKSDDSLHSPYESPKADHVYSAVSRQGIVPQAYISAKQAASACSTAGKRLCGAAEWRSACGGKNGTAFPYGKSRETGKCNEAGKSAMLMYYADKMQTGLGRSEMNDPRLNQLEGSLAKSGQFSECVNDFGLHDMVGNLHEWTADPNGTFQGGYYLDTHEHGDGCAYRTIAHNAEYHDYSTGFRCCSDPVTTE
jgi:formylglycine-generating enzyme